ncbi:type IV pilus modification protein PilV [Pseudoduganella danionis]|uniref:Type IV pilus modification protein PilV n=1 Tax=Pseudoduganella danionis TaxID=1890295 RepID=A0ABW9SSP0_9BURK|nr:type IV pilus modification protein PilV [Pseudoduganella danionis]MTW35177.1 type IV pilus modification protein PilV [Pseudoduganella danionis]
MRAHFSCSGFTLLEVLVALLLLALGIAGSAAMQLVALRVAYQDQLLVQASHLAGTLAERMRANAVTARDGTADNPYLFAYDAASGAAPPEPSVLCFGSACTRRQLALFDCYEAQLLVYRLLPAGRLQICRDQHPLTAGKLQWDCDGSPDAPLVIKLGWHGKLADGAAQNNGALEGTLAAPVLAMTVRVP